MWTEQLSVLLVEDDQDDYLITRDVLAGQDRVKFTIEWCADYEHALAAIQAERHDVYLIDYHLGAHTGLELVREGFASRTRAPVLILTGESSYEIDLEATMLGVTDFLVKGEITPRSLERSIRYAVSHHRALHELSVREERYALAARAANDGLWDWDLRTTRIRLSPRWYAILGMSEQPGEISSADWYALVHPDDLAGFQAAIDAHLDGRTPQLRSEHRLRHADGTWRWTLHRGLAVSDASGTPTRMAGSTSEIDERRPTRQALHDELTGLPNRAMLIDRIAHAARRALTDPNAGCALLSLEIDDLAALNAARGPATGDALLVAAGRRISKAVRPGDTVARTGGDEFAVLLDGVDWEDDAAIAAQRVQACFVEPFEIDGRQVAATASIGVALADVETPPGEALRLAGLAMRDAKRRGGGQFLVSSSIGQRRRGARPGPGVGPGREGLRALESSLRQALDHALLRVHFEPIVELSSGRVCGLEARAHWPESSAELAPRDLIAVAEETGMIGTLEMQVLRAALQALAHLRRAALLGDDAWVSVNVSPRHLEDPRFAGKVVGALAATGLPAEVLKLELTELTLTHEPEELQDVMAEVRAFGVGIHVDDFGTGPSPSVLRRFPVDALKIDGKLVRAMHAGDAAVRSVIELAHSLGLVDIAQGVEDAAQARRLRAIGCEFGQGPAFAEPLNAIELQKLLAGWSTARARAFAS